VFESLLFERSLFEWLLREERSSIYLTIDVRASVFDLAAGHPSMMRRGRSG
jgi:hypothetical protein